ncbi:Ig-like domain-containing protein, partial [Sinomonas mesophila]|uniref:DUF7948 domain-containing protein n=1 Tax=Sinomonas mesophila TaxID=1531955 RepID=UPI001C378880
MSTDSALEAYGKLPLSFVANAGQTDEGVRYYAQGAGFGFFFTEDKAVLSLSKGDRGHALELGFLGSSPDATLEVSEPAPGTVNYLAAGENHTNLPTYKQVVYRGLWPGIDMIFAGRDGTLKYEFHVAPGADPSDIRLSYAGADGLALGQGGELLISTPLGTLSDSTPRSYQPIGGREVAVQSRFALEQGTQTEAYGFALAGFDTHHPLVIDPALDYSTFLGGAMDDRGFSIAVDSAGNAYVTGTTTSTDFPTTTGAFDTAANGGADAFVTKLDATGTSLVYSTYLGGTSTENGTGIAVNSAGNAYVSGFTNSVNFPTTLGAFDTSLGGSSDAFVTKLNVAGTALVYSTYLGGSGPDNPTICSAGPTGCNGIAVDALGNAYVTGQTLFGFPTTPGAFATSPIGGFDAFVAKLNPAGAGASDLVYSTYLGGSAGDSTSAIALDAAGNAYVTGQTTSSNFPTSLGAFDATFAGPDDAFVTKLIPAGTGASDLAYSTYLGGTGGAVFGPLEAGFAIAVDATGSAYVTGATNSLDFPTTTGAFDTGFGGFEDAFVTKVNLTGTGLTYSTYLGGTSADRGSGIAVDTAGSSAVVTGRTSSTGFPTTTGAFDTTYNGADDAFVTKFNLTGSAVDYSSFVGGASNDQAHGIALDATGDAYVTGETLSLGFPTAGAFDTTFNSGADAFVTKLSPVAAANQPPTAVDDAYSTAEDTALVEPAPGVLGNDTDPDGDPLTAVLVAGPGNGTLTLNADGSFSYTPNANFNGTDTFTYKANDGTADSNTATVTITVTAANDAPTAVDDAYSTAEDTALVEPAPGVLGNDTDPDGDPLTAVLVAGPGNGTLTLNADGSFSYTPNANFNGTDTFTYKANDGTADSNT